MKHLLPLILLIGLVAAAARRQDDLEALRAEVAALPEAERPPLIELLDAAAADRVLAATRASKTAGFLEEQAAADDDLKRIQAELAAEDPPLPVAMEGWTVADYESRERQARADVEEARTRVTFYDQEATRREERRRDIPGELARLNTESQTASDAVEGAAPTDLPGRVQRAAQAARSEAVAREIEMLKAELSSYDSRRELLPRRLDRWKRRARLRTRDVEEWTRLHATAREAAAADAQRRTIELARGEAAQHPAIRGVIAQTQEYIERKRTAAAERDTARAARDKAQEDLDELVQRAANLRRKLTLVGLSDLMGEQFRRQYNSLESARQLRADRNELRRTYAAAEYEFIDLEENREAQSENHARVEALVAKVEADPDPPESEALRAVAVEAVQEQALHYNDLLPIVEQLVEYRLGHLKAFEALSEGVEEHRRFLEENILYVRSVEGGRLPSPADAWAALSWLTVEGAWPDDLLRALRKAPTRARTLLPLLLGLALVATRRRLNRALDRCGEKVRRYRTDRLGLTPQAVALTLGRAAAVPLLLAGAGLALATPVGQAPPAVALGEGLVVTAWILAPLFLLRALCRPAGLATAHLRWPSAACEAVRRELSWFLPFVAPFVLLGVSFQGEDIAAHEDSLGRPSTWVALIALATVNARLFGRERPLLRDWLRRTDGPVARAHGFLFYLAVLLPAVLVIVSALGYHYTAIEFAAAVRRSFVLVLGLVIARGLLSRWQVFSRRRLAVEQARARAAARAATATATEAEAGAGAGTEEGTTGTIDEDKVDIPAVDAQTKRLFDSLVAAAFAVGLYLIWAGVLPALSVLDRVQIYPSFALLTTEQALEPMAAVTLPGTESAPDPGTESTPEAEEETATPGLPGMMLTPTETAASATTSGVSLADLLLALALILGTTVLARNVPGLLEFAILVRLPLDAGSRYAIATIVRYVIVLTGMTASMGAIGIGWSTVKWLAAALTFGLAFGLQEIFANFVSGIILLIERPLRVGDFVTVDGVEGQVTRLRMRATTITDWDNREMLVPNKQFITASLVNWTLSDPITRIVIKVGIAYGSDVRLAEQKLFEVARSTKHVLETPGPSVVFREFGDSSLLLHLRVYVPNRENWPQTIHALHLGIDDAFREAGVEISFPQRDLHLRSVDSGAAARMRGENPTPEP